LKIAKILQRAQAGTPAQARTSRVRVLPWLCIAFFASAAHAETKPEETFPQVWLNPGIYSHHFDSSKGLRNNNIGLGAEVRLASDHALMAGTFINSNRQRSHYATYQWRPLHWQWAGLDIGAAIAVGGYDGYPNYRNGAWFVAPLPMLTVEGKTFGANISVIPTVANRFDGALAVQVKMRVW
jgi:hypothetical protein